MLLQKLFAVWLLLLLPLVGVVSRVRAEEIIISGNGANSSSEASANVVTEATTTQTNQATVTNNIDVDANTGGNSTSNNNGGENTITTGSASVDTNITNAGDISHIDLNCCPTGGGKINISGNADNSTNTANVNAYVSTTITIAQVANINNSLGVDANSGYNRANNNSGNVDIQTGNVSVNTDIKNKGINTYDVKAPIGMTTGWTALILDNASSTTNTVNLNLNNSLVVLLNNLANINNLLDINANSGHNTANNNDGNVTIKTGDVAVNTKIDNTVNQGKVEIDCCKENNPPIVTPTPTPTPTDDKKDTPPSNNPPSGGSNNPPSSSGPSILGATTGQILPVTGSYWIVILTLISALMFALGLYLRRHPGQDPSKAYLYC